MIFIELTGYKKRNPFKGPLRQLFNEKELFSFPSEILFVTSSVVNVRVIISSFKSSKENVVTPSSQLEPLPSSPSLTTSLNTNWSLVSSMNE